MRRIALLGLCVAALFSARCLLQDPRQTAAGGKFVINISNPQGTTVAAGTYEAKTIAGLYNAGDRRPGTDAGFSTLTGTPNPLDQGNCKSVGAGFVGKPEAGKTWQLLFVGGDGGVSDAGFTDAGVNFAQFANGVGSLIYSEGCIQDGEYKVWRSTTGTLTVTSVEEPAELPQGARPGANKTVKFTYTGVKMSGQDNAPGTFDATGEGEILLMTGMDQ